MQPFYELPHMLRQPELSLQSPHSASSAEEKLFSKHLDDIAISPSTERPITDDIPTTAICPPPFFIFTLPTPSPATFPDLSTATVEGRSSHIADGTLAPQSISKAPLTFRLPSFQLLGIAAPHPNDISVDFESSIIPVGVGPPSEPNDPLHTGTMATRGSISSPPPNNFVSRLFGNPTSSERHSPAHKVVRQYVLTQTPPDDSGVMNWGMNHIKSTANDPSNDQSGPHPNTNPDGDAKPARLPNMTLTPPVSTFRSDNGPWINQALPSILDNMGRNSGCEHLRILSHALPSPSSQGHAFPAVIEAIQQATGPNSITWMNIFHAVSGKFSLADLPKSPPTTPAPPNEGEDYFTTKVFNMAVEVPDYSEKIAAKPMLQKFRPAISPSSIDISIVERYIPPTSTTEFAELFSSTGRSFLSDRLIELSTKHGTLLFIYPTKTGGATFRKEYLAPLLDPILREMGTTHDLSINLLQAIGSMPAVEKLFSFEEMQARLQEFCRSLSVEGSTPHGRYHATGATYTVVHAAPQYVPLTRKVWVEDWWAKQEKLKIQKAFENHDVHKAGTVPGADAKRQLATAKKETRAAARPGVDNHVLLQRAKTQELMRAYERTRGEKRPDDNEMLILKLLKDVATKSYPRGEPVFGVEVGVFVVQKTLRKKGTAMDAYV